MKSWRLYLLLLLAVLLPVRGAMAAAMLCPGGDLGLKTPLAVQAANANHATMDHGTAHVHAGTPGTPDHGTAEKCHMCAAYCSLTPLLSTLPTWAGPLDASPVRFQDRDAPPPDFVCSGPERPPRTC